MDLTDIQRKTKLSLRRLRYVLDHKVLPGTRVKTDASRLGHPRSFTPFEGFCIAIAAALLEAGVRRDLAARFFDRLNEMEWRDPIIPGKKEHPLLAAFSSQKDSDRAEIADGRYLALRIDKDSKPWVDLESPRLNPVQYQPRVIVGVDLSRIRDDLRK